MKRLSCPALFTLLSLLIPMSLFAQLKSDSSFNRTGSKVFPGNKGLAELGGTRCVPQTDGSVLIAGFHGPDSLTVIRLAADGSLDQSFGTGGSSSVYTNGLQPLASSLNLIVQRDKKIVVMASGQQITSPYNNSRSSILLVRLNANGTPDRGFAGSGLLTDQPVSGYQFNPLALAIDSTGSGDKFYVASLATEDGSANCPLGFGKWCISKYNADGSRDLSFNGTGYMLQTASYIRGANTISPMANIYALKVLASGKLLAAGAYCNYDSAFFMFRMNPDGSWDPAFAANGRAYMPFRTANTGNAQITSAHILSDNSVVLAMSADLYSNGSYDSSLLYAVRFNNDGSVASSFGEKGMLTTSYQTEGHHQLTLDASDRLLLTWNRAASGSQYMHFRRFLSNGKPDQSFGLNGQTSIEPIRSDTVAYAEVFNAAWTTTGSSLVVVERRWSTGLWGHLGVFRYSGVSKAAAPSAVATTPALIASVYPQPATAQLMIRLAGAKEVKALLVNAAGQAVMSKTLIDGLNTIDVSQLARGIYYLSAQDAAGGYESKKLILE